MLIAGDDRRSLGEVKTREVTNEGSEPNPDSSDCIELRTTSFCTKPTCVWVGYTHKTKSWGMKRSKSGRTAPNEKQRAQDPAKLQKNRGFAAR